jgi:putative membrane protein insertion efficiency factor
VDNPDPRSFPSSRLPVFPSLDEPASRKPSPAAWLALKVIRGYQRFISPLAPPACRFEPTCSQYAYEAIAKYGIIKGGRLAAWRVLRCNPWGGSGYDPVR